MAAASLTLPAVLKRWVDKVAAHSGRSAHAFMVEAMAMETERAGLRRRFGEEAQEAEAHALRGEKALNASEAFGYVKALSVRTETHAKEQASDFDSVERAIREIEKQIGGFEEITTNAKTIASGTEKIQNRVRIMQEALVKQVEKLDDGLRGLRSAMTADSSDT